MEKGSSIRFEHGELIVPTNPILPFIPGDGTGLDIWAAAFPVFQSALYIAYSGTIKPFWLEVLAGQKAFDQTGSWLPEETLEAFRLHLVGIKGPLTTPVGGGITSLNVKLRQELDLYTCLRPVRWFNGVPSPVRNPKHCDMVVFRENTEDIYSGIEYLAGTPEVLQVINFLQEKMGVKKIRFPQSSSIGIKPVSSEGTERLVRAAISYAIKHNRKSVTLVHKGNIMKFTEGMFMKWGYELAKNEFGAIPLDGGPWLVIPNGLPGAGIIIKDVIADAFLQQILLHPKDYDVIATLNLNGDYISDALAAQVGGIGIAPGANINYTTGHSLFEATHGTAPKYAGKDKVNPLSVILSGSMMFEYLGWEKATEVILKGIEKTLANKTATYDFAMNGKKVRKGWTVLKCSEFSDELIKNM